MAKSSARCGLSLALLAVSALFLSGYGGRLAPSHYGAMPALMVLAYPAIVLSSLALCIVWLIMRRWKLAVWVFFAVVLTWPSLSANFPINLTTNTPATTSNFTVMSYNVRSFSDKVWTDTAQMHPALRVILDEDADFVILLQPVTRGLGYDERKSIRPWLAELEQHYPYRTHSRYDNVDLLSKYPFRVSPLSEPGRNYRYFPYVIESISRYAFDIRLPNQRQLRIIGAYMTSFALCQSAFDCVDQNKLWKILQ